MWGVSVWGSRGLPGCPAAAHPVLQRQKHLGIAPDAEVPADGQGRQREAVNGVLYAVGGFWTPDNSPDPVHASGRGPKTALPGRGFRDIPANGLWVTFPRARSDSRRRTDSLTAAPARLFVYRR